VCLLKKVDKYRDISLEEFEYTLKINLTASFILVKYLVEGMKKNNWGRIIFISSIAARGTGVNGCRTSKTGSNSITSCDAH
jgi:3-oxoacyl-[acyl-carrier protein] reductase